MHNYLDIISRMRDEFDLPVAAYYVSGEAATKKDWIDEPVDLLPSAARPLHYRVVTIAPLYIIRYVDF
jgi:delta-aminolevulinic acid dehydratase/porphobilinogen synthase